MHLRDNLRGLSDRETAQLEAQGNTSSDWSRVRVVHDFSPGLIHASLFLGDCVLGRFTADPGTDIEGSGTRPPQGVYHSTLHNTCVGSAGRIHRCPMISDTILDRGVSAIALRSSGVDERSGRSYANGISVDAGIETGGRSIGIFAELDPELATLLLTELLGPDHAGERETYARYVADYRREANLPWTYVGPDSRLDSCQLAGSWLGPFTEVGGGSLVSGSTVLSSRDEPVRITSGAQLERAIIQWQTVVESRARVEDSLVMEASHLQHDARIVNATVGSNSALGGGEITSSFVGPFTTAHHQSLVIAACWPGGRGNLGYGANVGSNHTSRVPDQEVWPGEGMFFGLDCAVKFPANFSRSPYSAIASGVVVAPQRIAMPFSLIVDRPVELAGLAPGRDVPSAANQLIPGWMLRSNLYAVMRNEYKFARRRSARRLEIDFDVLRPEIRSIMADAITALEAPEREGRVTAWYLPGELEGTGAGVVRDSDRVAAIESYRRAIRLGELRERRRSGETLNEGDLRELGVLLEWLAHGVRRSRSRDRERGSAIIPDYQLTHATLEEDPFVRQVDEEIAMLLGKGGT